MLVFQFVENRPLRLLAAADLLVSHRPTVGACAAGILNRLPVGIGRTRPYAAGNQVFVRL